MRPGRVVFVSIVDGCVTVTSNGPGGRQVTMVVVVQIVVWFDFLVDLKFLQNREADCIL